MSQFSVYSKAELVEKVEALQRLTIAQEKAIAELRNVIKMYEYDRIIYPKQIEELVEQRNQLAGCVKANLVEYKVYKEYVPIIITRSRLPVTP